MKIITRKLYTRLQEKDYGMSKHSIVLFDKRPTMYGTREGSTAFSVESYTKQYQYFLRVDLWIFIFEFNWMGKILK